MSLISLKEFNATVKDYLEFGADLDQVLYDLCKKYPGHSKWSEIYAKVNIIGLSYTTGIQRQIKSSEEYGEVMEILVEHLFKKRKEVDKLWKELDTIGEPLTQEMLPRIASVHGRFTKLVSKVCRNVPRCFAAKYLHFHCSAIPIYDSIVVQVLGKDCPWKKEYDELLGYVHGKTKEADDQYVKFLVRFWLVYSEAVKAKKKQTVKLLDNYLLLKG